MNKKYIDSTQQCLRPRRFTGYMLLGCFRSRCLLVVLGFNMYQRGEGGTYDEGHDQECADGYDSDKDKEYIPPNGDDNMEEDNDYYRD